MHSVKDGVDAAIDWVNSALAKPVQTWVIVEPVRLHVRHGDFSLGVCDVSKELPDGVPELVRRDLAGAGPFITTRIEARDIDSAEINADQRFAETLAIVSFSEGGEHTGHDRDYLAWPEGSAGGRRSRSGLIFERVTMPNGKLFPFYKVLSEAAALPEDSRSDWQRRVLSAMRWWAKGALTSWPAEALVAYMVALETLLVKDRHVQQKGKTIARAVTARWQLKDISAQEQEDWLVDLYRRRNDAAHAGRSYLEELQVGRLGDITYEVLVWAGWHLSSDHTYPRKACGSFAEIRACQESRIWRYPSASGWTETKPPRVDPDL